MRKTESFEDIDLWLVMSYGEDEASPFGVPTETTRLFAFTGLAVSYLVFICGSILAHILDVGPRSLARTSCSCISGMSMNMNHRHAYAELDHLQQGLNSIVITGRKSVLVYHVESYYLSINGRQE